MNGEPLPPPRKKSTSPWIWVGCGCLIIIAGVLAFVAFVVFVIFAAIRSAEPYKDGLERARADARVQQSLGAPVEPGWFISGSIQTENRSGDCDITIPLKGSKQKGSLRVVGTKDDGRWTYTKMLVTPATGPPIDLLE
ncbi:MAG TPA: cytochrome c oxidase assembly factor Coa1 family protein [Thermoanaerobaculia bacterium]|nr:cytochrome c oxidase assembly factor Coa1 family protein [Thermoanaerobaculia bacterium]